VNSGGGGGEGLSLRKNGRRCAEGEQIGVANKRDSTGCSLSSPGGSQCPRRKAFAKSLRRTEKLVGMGMRGGRAKKKKKASSTTVRTKKPAVFKKTGQKNSWESTRESLRGRSTYSYILEARGGNWKIVLHTRNGKSRQSPREIA